MYQNGLQSILCLVDFIWSRCQITSHHQIWIPGKGGGGASPQNAAQGAIPPSSRRCPPFSLHPSLYTTAEAGTDTDASADAMAIMEAG